MNVEQGKTDTAGPPSPARGTTDTTGQSSGTAAQRSAVIASFLSWAFDAFDFFLLVFVLRPIAAEFGVPITSVTVATILTRASSWS
jgi:hypothetical protein